MSDAERLVALVDRQGLTLAEAGLLAYFLARGDPLTGGGVRYSFNATKEATAKALRGLIERGFITRLETKRGSNGRFSTVIYSANRFAIDATL